MRHNKLLLIVLGAFCLTATANATLINPPNVTGGPSIATVAPSNARGAAALGSNDIMNAVQSGAYGMRGPGGVTASLDVAGFGAFSCDLQGAPCNLSVDLDLGSVLGTPGADVSLDGLGWDLTIESVGASWLSEAVISFQNPASTELFSLTAGVGDNFAGNMFYTSGGVIDLETALGFAPVIAGGILTLEFYESFDDVANTIDAFYLDPSVLTLEFSAIVAEPAIVALFGFGLLGLAIARRRRS